MASKLPAARKPLLAIDKTARDAFMPYRGSAPVRALSWLSELGDQPQMRALAGGMLAAGVVRADGRMIRAGARMLIAHELATAVKNAVKHRIDRARPRSATSKKQQQPKPGRSRGKEDTSFPSGHSAGSMAVALALAAEYPRHRSKAVATAGSVALAQMPRCAHYPTDVAAGLVLGATAERIVALAFRGLAAAFRR
jgi:membrane-associated phospholipid phosphatase